MNLPQKRSSKERGFTLIEAIISMAVLSFGILSLAAVYAQGMYYANLAQYDYIAQKKAEEAVEAIFTARDSKTLPWASIQSLSNGGVFLEGPQPMLQPGPDGLIGANTDTGAPDDVIVIGPNSLGQIGTSSDKMIDLNPWMKRTIVITQVTEASGPNPNLRMITITITYQIGKIQRTHTLISYISSFA
jgi:type II secretory pathway pseudopilin PulG